MGEERILVVGIAAIILGSLILLFLLFWVGWRWSQRAQTVSPYTGVPLRRAIDIPYSSAEKILNFLYNFKQYDNRTFLLNRAAFCRETGRIFQDCVSWFDTIHVDWSFIQKRFPGHYVSWGSLNRDQQEEIRKAHPSLEGFQTAESSPLAIPRMIESEYAYTKPGPLYVDLVTQVIIGWKQVPGTEFEVLIVQKPFPH